MEPLGTPVFQGRGRQRASLEGAGHSRAGPAQVKSPGRNWSAAHAPLLTFRCLTEYVSFLCCQGQEPGGRRLLRNWTAQGRPGTPSRVQESKVSPTARNRQGSKSSQHPCLSGQAPRVPLKQWKRRTPSAMLLPASWSWDLNLVLVSSLPWTGLVSWFGSSLSGSHSKAAAAAEASAS